MIDFGSALTYMFDDENWPLKLGIGGVIALLAVFLSSILIGIVLFFPLAGYTIKVLRNVNNGHTPLLPEWTDWGELFRSGFFVTAITFIYNIPVVIIACGALIIQGVSAELISNPDGALIIILCLCTPLVLVAILCNVFVPAAIIRYAQFDTLAAAFQFREIFEFIKNNFGDYLIILLVSYGAQTIASFGFIICLVGIFFTNFWSYLVTAHFLGQLARLDNEG